MRIFLSVLLFDIAFRGLTVAFPWADWAREMDMRLSPVRLPSRAEMAKLRAEATPERPYPVRDEVLDSLDSVWAFFKPWPTEKTRKHLHSGTDWGVYALCWLNSRLEFAENVLGFNEEWPMFSPNVSRLKRVARARLTYDDGSEIIQRNHGDPEDLTHYSHWFEEKILDHELKVKDSSGNEDEAFGYCNLLSHRYRLGPRGQQLVKIRLYMVRYYLPPPGEDARAFLAAQTGKELPEDQIGPDFYEYNVAQRRGKWLGD
jgi:hypothetical protein